MIFCATGITDGDLVRGVRFYRQSGANAFDPRALQRNRALHRIDPPARCARRRALTTRFDVKRARARPGRRRRRFGRLRRRAHGARFGCDVALVDRGPLGGLCILRGCMPSKALIASSDALADARDARRAWGQRRRASRVDMPFIARAQARARQGVRRLPHRGHRRSFRSIAARRAFFRRRELAVGDDVVLEAPKFVIATGSVGHARALPGLDGDGLSSTATRCWSSNAIPESVDRAWAAVTPRCELGQFFARMGARTTMLIRSGHLLTAERRRRRRRADAAIFATKASTS